MKVIKQPHQLLGKVEEIRNVLCNNKTVIDVQDYGAGSFHNNSNSRSISYIAKTSSSSPRFSSLLHGISVYNNAQSILELGTSFGVNTCYLAQKPEVKVSTIEGSPSIAAIAENNFNNLTLTNINLITGNIDEVLPGVLKGFDQLDLVYMDANHTYEATIKYFNEMKSHLHEESIVVLDDIHWSASMQKAWIHLKNEKSVSLSMDIYDAGILFFKKGLTKKNYIVEY